MNRFLLLHPFLWEVNGESFCRKRSLPFRFPVGMSSGTVFRYKNTPRAFPFSSLRRRICPYKKYSFFKIQIFCRIVSLYGAHIFGALWKNWQIPTAYFCSCLYNPQKKGPIGHKMSERVFSFSNGRTIMTGVVQRCTGYLLYTFVLFYFILIFAAPGWAVGWECERNGKTDEKRKIRAGFCHGGRDGGNRHRLRRFRQQ